MAQENATGVPAGTLVLGEGNLGLDVDSLDPADVQRYTELAGRGLIDGSSGNCNAVQDDRGFRTRTTVSLTAS